MNNGVIELNAEHRSPEPRTLVISGFGRAGTSAVAQIVDGLGVYLGETPDKVFMEDVALARAFESGKVSAAIRREVERRNEAHEIWGFKRPMVVRYSDVIERTLRNPVYIVMMRDPVAIAQRNMISMSHDHSRALSDYARQLAWLNKFIARTKRPTLLVSYEKLLVMPESVVASITEFLSLTAQDGTLDEAVNRIEANEPRYVDAAAGRKSTIGFVDAILSGRARGWARDTDDPQRKVHVRLMIAGRILGEDVAELHRADVAARLDTDGNCGFLIDLPADVAGIDKSEIAVIDAQNGRQISPMIRAKVD